MGMAGGRHCADVRGAYSGDEWATVAQPEERAICSGTVEGSTPSSGSNATAPLFEIAAAHDGQPAKAWLKMFYRMYGSLE